MTVKLLILIVITNLILSDGKIKRVAYVDRFDVCYIPENPPYKLHYFELQHNSNNDYFVTTSAEVTEDMEAPDLAGNLQLLRCRSKEAPDTCEKFANLKPVSNICSFIETEALGFKSMMNSFTPPVKCPFKRGNYSAKNLRCNVNSVSMFPLDGYFWKVEANGYWKKRKVGTICIEGSVKNIQV